MLCRMSLKTEFGISWRLLFSKNHLQDSLGFLARAKPHGGDAEKYFLYAGIASWGVVRNCFNDVAGKHLGANAAGARGKGSAGKVAKLRGCGGGGFVGEIH